MRNPLRDYALSISVPGVILIVGGVVQWLLS